MLDRKINNKELFHYIKTQLKTKTDHSLNKIMLIKHNLFYCFLEGRDDVVKNFLNQPIQSTLLSLSKGNT